MGGQRFIRQLRLFVSATIVCVNTTTFASAAIDANQITIPSAKLLGKSLGSVKAFDSRFDGQILPESVHFDLDGDVVIGLIATYSDKVRFDDLVDAINRTQEKWWRDSDRKMANHGVSVWRNEKTRVAYQASGSQIIMIWLDRRVTDQEASADADALIAIEAAESKEAAKELDDTMAD